MTKMSITATAGGWLAVCECGAEAFHTRRPTADRWAHEHTCKTPPRTKAADKPRPRAAWDDRGEATWIDQL